MDSWEVYRVARLDLQISFFPMFFKAFRERRAMDKALYALVTWPKLVCLFWGNPCYPLLVGLKGTQKGRHRLQHILGPFCFPHVSWSRKGQDNIARIFLNETFKGKAQTQTCWWVAYSNAKHLSTNTLTLNLSPRGSKYLLRMAFGW